MTGGNGSDRGYSDGPGSRGSLSDEAKLPSASLRILQPPREGGGGGGGGVGGRETFDRFRLKNPVD